MKNKKIIERRLSLANKYKVISISRQNLSDIDVSVIACDNCGVSIVNIATIQDQTGKKYSVGLDCMETLTKALINLSDYEQEKYSFNSALRFYSLFSKADKITFRRGFVTVVYTDKKGNRQEKSEMQHVLDNYNFDLKPFQKPLTEREKRIEQNISDYENGKPFKYTDGDAEMVLQRTAHDSKNRLSRNGQLMRCIEFSAVEQYIEKYTI